MPGTVLYAWDQAMQKTGEVPILEALICVHGLVYMSCADQCYEKIKQSKSRVCAGGGGAGR